MQQKSSLRLLVYQNNRMIAQKGTICSCNMQKTTVKSVFIKLVAYMYFKCHLAEATGHSQYVFYIRGGSTATTAAAVAIKLLEQSLVATMN